MNEPLLQPAHAPEEQQLWNRAPAWRNLVVAASLLTIVALALPLMPQPETKSPAPPTPHAPVIHTAAVTPRAKALPSAPAPAAPTPVTHATLNAPAIHAAPATPPSQTASTPPPLIPHAPPMSAPAPIPAPATPPAQLASASPQSAAEPATADPSKVCTLTPNMPVTPHPQDVGRVVGFDDRAIALARIQLTQSQSGGLIDPAYVDNPRAHIDLGNGHIRIVLVPKGMTVNIGDIVMVQSGYRNLNLPCNYVPNLITSDLGPQANRQQPPTP